MQANGIVFIVALLMVPFVLQPSYALDESDAKDIVAKVIDFIKEKLFQGIDQTVDPIDVTTGNPLETTNDEKMAVKESGKQVLDDVIETAKDTHALTENAVKAVDPHPIDPIILFLGSMFIVSIIMIKWGRKIIKDSITIFLILIAILGMLAVLSIVGVTSHFTS